MQDTVREEEDAIEEAFEEWRKQFHPNQIQEILDLAEHEFMAEVLY